jgi:hypothetical protein
MQKKLAAFADRCPPILCRLLARTGRGEQSRPLTNLEIARRSGMTERSVLNLSRKTSWAGLTLDVIDAFTSACGVSLFHLSRQKRFWRDGKKEYLFNGSPRQRKMLHDLMTRIKQRSKPAS